MKPQLILNHTAESDIARYRFVAAGTGDMAVTQASAGTDAIVGASTDIAATNGGRVDVVVTGMPTVEFGGTVAFGDRVTSDSLGRAVKAVAGNRVAGVAYCSGAEGDWGMVLLGTGATQPAPVA